MDVPVSKPAEEAIVLLVRREGVSRAEAARRLLGYGAFVYRAIADEGFELLVRHPDGSEREVAIHSRRSG